LSRHIKVAVIFITHCQVCDGRSRICRKRHICLTSGKLATSVVECFVDVRAYHMRFMTRAVGSLMQCINLVSCCLLVMMSCIRICGVHTDSRQKHKESRKAPLRLHVGYGSSEIELILNCNECTRCITKARRKEFLSWCCDSHGLIPTSHSRNVVLTDPSLSTSLHRRRATCRPSHGRCQPCWF